MIEKVKNIYRIENKEIPENPDSDLLPCVNLTITSLFPPGLSFFYTPCGSTEEILINLPGYDSITICGKAFHTNISSTKYTMAYNGDCVE